MAKVEIGGVGGFVAYVEVILILIILLGVAALIVVNALKASPWGTFTIAMTMPIALLMGAYLRRVRPGKGLGVSALRFVVVLGGNLGGGDGFPKWSPSRRVFVYGATPGVP